MPYSVASLGTTIVRHLKHTIAVYEVRAAASSQERLPKTLQAAAKLRSENGNGKIRNANGRLVNPQSDIQQKWARMRAVLTSPNNGHARHPAVYLRNGYLTKSAKGVYSITAKGKQRLAELTDAPTP
jgi:hypothetical protein